VLGQVVEILKTQISHIECLGSTLGK
jgi:hypothetical protein